MPTDSQLAQRELARRELDRREREQAIIEQARNLPQMRQGDDGVWGKAPVTGTEQRGTTKTEQ